MVAGPPRKRHRVVSAAWPSVINRGDKLSRVWEEKRAGVDPRAAGLCALPHAVCTGPCSPASAARQVLQHICSSSISAKSHTVTHALAHIYWKSAKSHTLTHALAHIAKSLILENRFSVRDRIFTNSVIFENRFSVRSSDKQPCTSDKHTCTSDKQPCTSDKQP